MTDVKAQSLLIHK